MASSLESSPQRLHEESKEEDEPVLSPGRVDSQKDAAVTAQDKSAPRGVEGAKQDYLQSSITDEASLLKQISKSCLPAHHLDSLLSQVASSGSGYVPPSQDDLSSPDELLGSLKSRFDALNQQLADGLIEDII